MADPEEIGARVTAARAEFGRPKEGSPECEKAEQKRMQAFMTRPNLRGKANEAKAPENHPAHPDAPRPEAHDWYDDYLSGNFSGR